MHCSRRGRHGLAVVGCDRSTAEAVDQNSLIVGIERGRQLGFHADASGECTAPHHPRKTAAAEGRCQPLSATQHQQIGRRPAAQGSSRVQEQSVVDPLLLGFSAGLDRLPVGKGLATVQAAGGVAALMATGDGGDG